MFRFIINHLIKATSPVKVYEYMAAGKPVVATQIPELAPYKDAVYIAKNAPEFSACIKRHCTKVTTKRKKRILYSSQYVGTPGNIIITRNN